ncbi:hypothetical protein HNR60_003680 [Rhodopseudomonas rhenobacensis]|uniref:Glycosyltransferase RgtA/B/C/D-like domain-containing protein n=1 Tax=Rhodopseudomonas rhenobacensis TaxID=87461 RepID=A0A7W7Z6H7_9BRAD|nr:hypothetical protein [Rhodopseudomonas rhenobacensis]MBB5048909.1 hypothetical protein [Rhodopseudomonas rhenobacensis]
MSAVHSTSAVGQRGWLLPLWIGAGVYLFQFVGGNDLLQDSDIFWQIEVGRWIIDHHAVPYSDIYSFTKPGAPWISSSWLSQLLYAASDAQAGWAGVVALSALAIAATFALFAQFLQRYVEPALATLLVMAAYVLSIHHLLARPHILAMPVMVAWFAGLISAADARRAPSLWLLPLLALWANLHGGFGLGLVLLGGVALEAVWSATPARRVALGLRWMLFGFGAVAACCCTPYGYETLLASRRILDLGQVLAILSEWAPADFSRFGAFEASVLGLLGFALYRGLTLSPPRILLVLGLLHMALSHVRSIEAFALLVPLIVARPWSAQLGGAPQAVAVPSRRGLALAAVGALTLFAASLVAAPYLRFALVADQVPKAAVAVLQQRGAERVFNAYEFGGYLVAAGVKPFIDGRAELYGEKFVVAHHRAVAMRDPDLLPRLLDDYRIDATLLAPSSPAVKLLDRLPEWQRVYSDAVAVVHARR